MLTAGWAKAFVERARVMTLDLRDADDRQWTNLRRGLENAGFAATEIAIGDYFPDEELFFATIGHRSGQIAEVIFDELGSLEIGGVRRLDDLAERGLVGREAWAALEVLRFDEIL
jgi:hypothetical protein